MDKRIMELRIKQWITIIEEQGKSGLNKAEWCTLHGVDRTTFFRWQKRVRAYLLNQWEDQPPLIPSSAQTDETGFVEISSAQVPLMEMAEPADQCAGKQTACSCPPSINIRYRDFSIDLSNGVDGEQLSRVLRAIKHAD